MILCNLRVQRGLVTKVFETIGLESPLKLCKKQTAKGSVEGTEHKALS